MVEVNQHLQVRLADRLDIDQPDQPVDVGVDGVLRVTDIAHLVEVDPPDVLPEEDVLQLALHLLVEHDAVAVEHPDIGRAAVQRGHLDMDRPGDRMFPRIELHHRDRQFAEVDDGRAGRHHPGDHGPFHHSGWTLAVAGRPDRRAFRKEGSEGRAKSGALFRCQLDVDQADQSV